MPVEKHSPGTHEVHNAITGRSAEKLIDRWANAVRAEVCSQIQNAGALTYQHQEKFRIEIKQQQGEYNHAWAKFRMEDLFSFILKLFIEHTSSKFEFTAFEVGQRMNYNSNSTYRDKTWSFWYKHTHFVVIRVRKKQALQIIIGGRKDDIQQISGWNYTFSAVRQQLQGKSRCTHSKKKFSEFKTLCLIAE